MHRQPQLYQLEDLCLYELDRENERLINRVRQIERELQKGDRETEGQKE